jgi:hypothetical protein
MTLERQWSKSAPSHIYMYMCVCVCMHIYIYIYIYICRREKNVGDKYVIEGYWHILKKKVEEEAHTQIA